MPVQRWRHEEVHLGPVHTWGNPGLPEQSTSNARPGIIRTFIVVKREVLGDSWNCFRCTFRSRQSGCGSSVRTTSPMPSSTWWSSPSASQASWTCARTIRSFCWKQVSVSERSGYKFDKVHSPPVLTVFNLLTWVSFCLLFFFVPNLLCLFVFFITLSFIFYQ